MLTVQCLAHAGVQFIPRAIKKTSDLGLSLKPSFSGDVPSKVGIWRYILEVEFKPSERTVASGLQEGEMADFDQCAVVEKLISEGKLDAPKRSVRLTLVHSKWSHLEV